MGTVTHCVHITRHVVHIHTPRAHTHHPPERGTATAFVPSCLRAFVPSCLRAHQVYCGNVANTVRIRCITAGVANTTASSPPPPPPAVALTNTD
jgi:hypothetical protein